MNARILKADHAVYYAYMAGRYASWRTSQMTDARLLKIEGLSDSVAIRVRAARRNNREMLYWLRKLPAGAA